MDTDLHGWNLDRKRENGSDQRPDAKDLRMPTRASLAGSLRLVCWIIRQSLFRNRPNGDADTNYDQNICGVEHTCMKWPKMDNGEVGNLTVTKNPIEKITHTTGDDERKTYETHRFNA